MTNTTQHVLEILEAVNEFFSHGQPIYPGSLALDDDMPMHSHVLSAIYELKSAEGTNQ